MISDIALKILAAKEAGLIKSNADFWRNYKTQSQFEFAFNHNSDVLLGMEKFKLELSDSYNEIKLVCAFDKSFPVISKHVKNASEKPYLLFYKGNINLLSNLNLNVAIVGVTDPDESTVNRETKLVSRLVENGITIVSGLALGCDSVSHEVALANFGKTIAILPSSISHIFPAENKILADEIVANDGLLVSEYYNKPLSRFEAISRFVERDRLQSMFSKAIVLISSYRKGEGDSGSRHAMTSALKYKIDRYVMFNPSTDTDNMKFGLNKDILNLVEAQTHLLKNSSVDEIVGIVNAELLTKNQEIGQEQVKLF